MQSLVKENLLLRLELDKKEFVSYFTDKLSSVDVQSCLFDITMLLVSSAEEKFYKKNKRLGEVKKSAVLTVLQRVLKAGYQEPVISGMIESILTNNDIRRSPWYIRWWRYIKAYFRSAGKK